MIVNLTPHAVNFPGLTVIPPSGMVARIDIKLRKVQGWEGFPCVVGERGQATGLPAPEYGTMFIVSTIVRESFPERKDLASPAELIRDTAGQVVGCKSLQVNP